MTFDMYQYYYINLNDLLDKYLYEIYRVLFSLFLNYDDNFIWKSVFKFIF